MMQNPFTRWPGRLTLAAAMAVTASHAAAQPYVYVLGQTDTDPTTNRGPQYITVIDATTNTKVTTVQAGEGCQCVSPQLLAISPDGAFVYAANEQGSTVSIMATATNTIVDTIGSAVSGNAPTALTVSPDGSTLYVLGSGGSNGLVAVNLATRTRARSTTLGVVQTRGIAITPDGSRLFITTYGSHSVKVVDAATFSPITTIPLAPATLPLGIAVSPDGQRAYVAGLLSSTTVVIDTQTNAVVATVPTAGMPEHVALVPTLARAFVSGGALRRIDTVTNTSIADIPGVGGTRPVAALPGGSTVFAGGANVYAVSTATNTVTMSWPVNQTTEGVPTCSRAASSRARCWAAFPRAARPRRSRSIRRQPGSSTSACMQ